MLPSTVVKPAPDGHAQPKTQQGSRNRTFLRLMSRDWPIIIIVARIEASPTVVASGLTLVTTHVACLFTPFFRVPVNGGRGFVMSDHQGVHMPDAWRRGREHWRRLRD